jgi:hypothetical protein
MLARWICLVATAGLVLLIGLIKPIYNWDVIGYVAAAYHADGLNGAALTTHTYGDLMSAVGAAKFDTLVRDDPNAKAAPGFKFLETAGYKRTVFQDPKALEQHVPLYAIRIAYVQLMRALKVAGLGYVQSSYAIGAVCAAAGVVLASEMLVMAGGVTLLTSLALPAIVLGMGVVELARLSTPDAMANAMALLLLLLLLKSSPWSLVVAVLLPLARTDFVLLSGLAAAYEFFRGRRRAAAVALAASLVVYVLANRLVGGYGWLTIFNFTLIRLDPYPAALVPSHAPMDYIRPYGVMVADLAKNPHVLIYAAAIAMLYRRRETLRTAGFAPLTIVVLAFVVLHLLLFPAYMSRFFVFAAMFACVWVVGNLPRKGAPAAISR